MLAPSRVVSFITLVLAANSAVEKIFRQLLGGSKRPSGKFVHNLVNHSSEDNPFHDSEKSVFSE